MAGKVRYAQGTVRSNNQVAAAIGVEAL